MREGGLYIHRVTHVHYSGTLKKPSNREEVHACQEVIEPGSSPIADALITSYVYEDVRSFSL